MMFALVWCTNVSAQESYTPVSIVTAKTGTVNEEIRLTGSVASIRTSRISPKVEGYIEKLLVDEGDAVKKGDPVMYFDRQLAEIEIARVIAQLNEAKAREKEFIRQRDETAELVKKKHIAATSYEAAVAEVEINATVVQRLEAQLKRQQVILKYHVLYAPFDGIITNKLVEVGQWVQTDTPLFELTELNPLRVEVPVPQYYFTQIKIGTQVKIKYDAIPDREFTAQVTSKVPVSSQNTRTLPIMIRVENKQQLIAPGMSVRVIFQLATANTTQSVLLPRDAVVQKTNGTKTVWIVADNNDLDRVSPVLVKTGKSYLSSIEITSDNIKPGDRVIVKGNELLSPDQTVTILEELEY
ncbi:MAG: hemolysin D [marine bacterium B5-7]|nr:MAG: hemolysin D [marine bacterium B5-7]